MPRSRIGRNVDSGRAGHARSDWRWRIPDDAEKVRITMGMMALSSNRGTIRGAPIFALWNCADGFKVQAVCGGPARWVGWAQAARVVELGAIDWTEPAGQSRPNPLVDPALPIRAEMLAIKARRRNPPAEPQAVRRERYLQAIDDANGADEKTGQRGGKTRT
jgi:hypothetical protein